MPKVSRDSAEVEDHGIVEDRHGEIEGYTVNIVTFRQDIDATPMMKGLPDDRCQCPHWGYVVKGRMTMRFGDREEAYEAGDAFYAPPGHVPVKHEPGTEIVQFSPTEELKKTEAVMMKNMQEMQG
jgi:mannose-6-phosphate isomerase-like protein (cupin superfamily)